MLLFKFSRNYAINLQTFKSPGFLLTKKPLRCTLSEFLASIRFNHNNT